MTVEPTSALGTAPDDYGSAYYGNYYDGSHSDVGAYRWETPEWQAFFTSVAERIIGLTDPKTSLDVGCARGMLVQALAAKGVDARGTDISEFAIESAHPDVRDRLFVSSATEPIDGRYDLISCIETIEHMSPADAQLAIDNMCAATDVILFSSTPADFEEPTHINVHPTAQWAAWFAERGFYRRTDADVTFLASWAVLFERGDPAKREIVARYEALYAPVGQELFEKRRALLEQQRRVTELEQAKAQSALGDSVILERHASLTAIDHVIGLEATVARQKAALVSLEAELKASRTRAGKLNDKVREMYASNTWKLGRLVTKPLGKLKR